jgi:hypothetical protein
MFVQTLALVHILIYVCDMIKTGHDLRSRIRNNARRTKQDDDEDYIEELTSWFCLVYDLILIAACVIMAVVRMIDTTATEQRTADTTGKLTNISWDKPDLMSIVRSQKIKNKNIYITLPSER